MTGWAGAAELLARSKSSWRGTLVFIAQPAEEKGAGAASMLSDGLFTRFPKPDFAIAFHASAELPAGQAGVAPGYVTAYVDSVDIRIFGKGGHGAYPHMTVDPIVIGARTVMALQTLISREKNPLEPGVITVGAFHSGTKHNVISDEAHMQITVRSYKDEVQKQLVSGIGRIAKAEAAAAGAPREPSVVLAESTLPSTFNDPALAKRVKASLVSTLGEANVTEPAPVMAGEDFAEYGRAGVPAVLFWVGTVEEGKFRKAKAEGAALPSLHSSSFAPDRKPSIQTAARSLAGVVFDLLGRP
jgi:hippurate hydrolase